MSKKRVHEIAKELKGHGIELDNKEVVPPLKLDLPKGTRIEFHAEARGAAKERLAGTIDFDWTSSNENILRLEARRLFHYPQ